jgi:hypothetical protein
VDAVIGRIYHFASLPNWINSVIPDSGPYETEEYKSAERIGKAINQISLLCCAFNSDVRIGLPINALLTLVKFVIENHNAVIERMTKNSSKKSDK